MESADALRSTHRRNSRTAVTRQSLIDAAEKLIAEKGLGNVSTRDVLQAAGQRNQSALQYHFGGKDGLIRAVIAARTDQLDQRRVELLSELPSDPSLHDLASVLIQPMTEVACATDGGREHLMFLSQAVTRPGFDLERAIEGYRLSGLDQTIRMIFDKLGSLEPSEQRMRLNLVLDLSVIALKRWAAVGCEGRTREQMVTFLCNIAVAIFEENA